MGKDQRLRQQRERLVIGVHYKLPVAESTLLQLQEATCLQILVLLGDFSQPGTCCKCSIANVGMLGE